MEMFTSKQVGLQNVGTEDEPTFRGILYRLGEPIKACPIDRAIGEKDLNELLIKLDETTEVSFHWRSGNEIWVDATSDFEIPLPDRFTMKEVQS